MTTSPAMAFVIPVRNDAARLARCLASIALSAAATPVQIVVADNGSTDDTPSTAMDSGATVVSVPNRVVAAVRNAGAAVTTAPLLAFVDADHELDPGWVEAAVGLMASPRITAIGADYHPPAEATWVQRTYDRLRRHPPANETTSWLPSGNLVVRRDAFEAIGGFDETLESCEDVDLCRRLRERGGCLIAAPSLYSTHHGDPLTLRAVFLSELWRGRDNLRVTMREARDPKGLLGLAFTGLYLVGLVGIVVAWPLFGVSGSMAALGLLAVLTALRVFRLVRAGGSLSEALRFAVTFDAARALALVIRVRHGTRRKA